MLRPSTLYIWDFDETILRIHAYGLQIAPADVAHRSLEADVADLDFFRAFVDQARSRGDLVAVASFGRFEVISAYLQRICPGVFARSTISTPSCVGTPDGCSVPGGKTPQLDALLATLLPDAVGEADGRSRVLFLDDSVPNVTVRRGWWHLQPAGTTLSGQAL